MQTKGKKLGQSGISMKSLKGAHFEKELQENCNRSKCYRTTKKGCIRVRPDGPRHGGRQPQARGEGARVKKLHGMITTNERIKVAIQNLKVFY